MFPISTTDLQTRQKFCWTACCQMMSWRKHCIVKYYYHNNALTSTSSSSSSSLGATTLGGFWPALRFRFTIFYLYTSVSNFSLSSSLNLLLLLWAISVLVFLLVLMSMFPTQLVFLTVLIVSILITCAAQRNLCNFINLTIVSFLIRISNSSFVFILHVPSLSCVSPYIFLSTLLSNISRRFCSVTVIAHVSQPFVTTGRMIDLYICSVLAALRSLFFISFLFAKLTSTSVM